MLTRARRAAKSASAPKVRRICFKCGVSHTAPTGKKCNQLNRELFPSTSSCEIGSMLPNDTEVGDRTSTPNNATKGTVNNVNSSDAPLVASTVIVPGVVSSEVSAPVLLQPVLHLDVADKLDHLANAVSAINSKLGVIRNEVQELKVKSNSSRAWNNVLNLLRVSARQEPVVTQPVNPPYNVNNVPITVLQAAPAVELVTVQELRLDPVLVLKVKANQQAFHEGTAQDLSQGRAQGDNINNNTLYDAHHRVHSNNFLSNQNNVRSRVLDNNFCERVGNPKHSNVYVCWPQQAVFIGADKRRLRYEELTQSHWTAGLTTMAAQEPYIVIQRNMFTFISSLLQDVCDVGFAVGRDALALILVMMEESRLSWLDLVSVQEVREK